MTNPHYFIAIPLPKLIKTNLAMWQDDLKEALSYKQWPAQDDFHITLKFLGAANAQAIDKLHRHLLELTMLSAFETTIHSIGTFGDKAYPRVVWAGVDLTEELSVLQYKVGKLTEDAGFKKEQRAYVPHITLAKKVAQPAPSGALDQIIRAYRHQRLSLKVNEVVLFKINLNQQPKYQVVHHYQLGE